MPERERARRRLFHFDPTLRLMSTVDDRDGSLWVHVKGAPEAVLQRCRRFVLSDGSEHPLGELERTRFVERAEAYEASGLRVLGIARRPWSRGSLPESSSSRW